MGASIVTHVGNKDPNHLTSKPTARQLQIIQLLAEDYSVDHIAEKLSITVRTVRKHIELLHVQLHVHSNIAVYHKLLLQGLIKIF